MLIDCRASLLMTGEHFSRDCLQAWSAVDEEMTYAIGFIYSENAFKHEKKVGVESESKRPETAQPEVT